MSWDMNRLRQWPQSPAALPALTISRSGQQVHNSAPSEVRLPSVVHSGTAARSFEDLATNNSGGLTVSKRRRPPSAKPSVPRLSAKALQMKAKADADTAESLRVARLSRHPFNLMELPASLQAHVFLCLAEGRHWWSMAAKASRGLRALIHAEIVLATDAAKAAAEEELSAALQVVGGTDPLQDPQRAAAFAEAQERCTECIHLIHKRDLMELKCFGCPPVRCVQIGMLVLLILGTEVKGKARIEHDPQSDLRQTWWKPFKQWLALEAYQAIVSGEMQDLVGVLAKAKEADLLRVQSEVDRLSQEGGSQEGGLQRTRMFNHASWGLHGWAIGVLNGYEAIGGRDGIHVLHCRRVVARCEDRLQELRRVCVVLNDDPE